MEEIFLKPLVIDVIPYGTSLSSLELIYSNRLNLNITSTIMLNITESITLSEFTNASSHDNNDGMNSLIRYRLLYRNYHGIISSFVCIFGLTCNLFNIIVLTRPLMRSSTNTILTSLALSDLLKMVSVLPAVIIFYCLPKSELKSEPDATSYFQVRFYMIHMLFTLTLHCISTWLTVFLAAFRYVFLNCKTLSAYVSSPDRAFIGVSIIVIFSIILCTPSYVEQHIVKFYDNVTSSSSNISKETISYIFQETEFSKSLSLRHTVFVLHSVIFKLIPCAFLLLFSFLLIQQLRDALQKSEQLHRHSTTNTITSVNNGRVRGRRREKENRRTTLMLVIVCALFLVTELPQGAILLLAFLSKTRSRYYFEIYQHLGDTFDILALINNSVNFILYCFMSRAFRDTFKQTFCSCQNVDRRPSASSVAQGIAKQRSINPSIAYDTVITNKCSDGYRTSLTPIIKTLSDNPTKKKKRKALKFLKQSNSVAL
ncbi:unnamed protein product [Adineta steineri]|uniref:G-protein coupled receptors family 1 profile domain-containing protein n=1 Tax=Adineta steineri TaxID=433720 RepID=A0A818NW56_9BILA|nr:unnamed protein product [Adineta steineri]CAF3612435.1 unnamed protein product [Adineta steineri]